MAHRKLAAPEPEPIYREVCIQIGDNDYIVDHDDWIRAIYQAEENWPGFIRETYFYSRDLNSETSREELMRIHSFLNECSSAIIYHNCWHGYSWIVLNEPAYARICNALNISKDFVLVVRDSRSFELVRRKTAPVTETPSIPAEPDNRSVAT